MLKVLVKLWRNKWNILICSYSVFSPLKGPGSSKTPFVIRCILLSLLQQTVEYGKNTPAAC